MTTSRSSLVVCVLAAACTMLVCADSGRATLVGYWKVENADPVGTATDYTGNGYDGTFNGGAAASLSVDGTRGTVLNLNPSSPTTEGGYISTPAISATGNTTWGAWVYLRSATNNDGGYPMFMTSGAGAYEFRFFSTTRRPEIINGATIAQSPTALALNSWHQIVHTGNGTNFVLYVDGSQVATGTGTAWPGGVVNFGHRAGDGLYFNGLLDDIQIWDNALSAGKVRALYSPLLGYDALDVEQLFSVYDATGSTTATLGNIKWSYITGLTGHNEGDWWEDGVFYLQLDSSGNGLLGQVQVPEPSTMALLVLSTAGLAMASPRRRRRLARAD